MAILSLLAGFAVADDKSGLAPTAISLPGGPGTIEGLGESFQPALNTGTARHSIRLVGAPGTAGHAPALTLTYEGGSGNGPLGFGWSLPLPRIQRRTDQGIPLYPDQAPDPRFFALERDDAFINEASEELVPVGDGVHFCKNETAFVRYRRVGDHWQGTRPDGTRLEFGLTEAGRITDAATRRTFAWLLERETDTDGNTILYTHAGFPGDANRNQRYLQSIVYGPGAPPWTNKHFVRLEYEDRPDWFEDCRAGFPVRTGKRLQSVVVGTQGPELEGHLRGDFDQDGLPDHLDRRYEFRYVSHGSQTHFSLLGEVRLVGADGVTALPPATFEYRVADPPPLVSAEGAVFGGVQEPPLVMDNPQVEFVDLNADGFPDVIRTSVGGGPHWVYLNAGVTNRDGQTYVQWRAPLEVGGDPRAWNVNLESDFEVAHLADMDGDGLADLVYKSAVGDVYYFANRGLLWGSRQTMAVAGVAPPSPFGSPDTRSADLDFDKRMDVIQSVSTGGGAEYRVWFNLGSGRYSPRITVLQDSGILFTQSGVQLADFNGDRVPDIARIRPDGVEIRAGLGYGRFLQPLTAVIPDEVLTTEEVARVKLTDVTGDGLDDVVLERAAPGRLRFWINRGNYTLGPRREISGIPTGVSPNAVVRWVDLNGNGTVDLVYADTGWTPRLQAVDLGHLLGYSGTPHLLVRIANGIGRVTRIEYRPSTAFALADALAGQPWPGPMPFAVDVVAEVVTGDSLGHEYVTRFRYHDGYYDPESKQFRGFAGAEQIDVGEPGAPTLVTRSTFDTGREVEAMKGRLLRLTAEQEDGRIFWDESTSWMSTNLMVGVNGTNVLFVYPTNRVKTIKELGQGSERRLESEFAYDNYGNQTLNANYGVVENGDRSALNDERITTTEYALNLDKWILRFPFRQLIKDPRDVVTSRTEFFYDDDKFLGHNVGQVAVGHLTMKREWIWPATNEAYVTSARMKYDGFGNLVAVLDPLAVAPGGSIDTSSGHWRQLEYDPWFRTYPVTETIHLGAGRDPLVFRAEYDTGFGTITNSIDFNGNGMLYGYDPFARLIRLVKPYDTTAFPTIEYDYVLASPFGLVGLVNYIETRQLDKDEAAPGDRRSHYFISRQFVDGLGRRLMVKEEADPDPEVGKPRVVVKEAVGFNQRQRPAFVVNPHYSTVESADLDGLLGFEDITATNWTGIFHNEGRSVLLGLADAHKISSEYDATLREVKVINPDRTFRGRVYKPLFTESFDEEDTDPASSYCDTPMIHYQDGLGRLVQVDEVVRLDDEGRPAATTNAWSTRYGYDLNDQLTHILDSQRNEKFFSYDGLKRKVRMDDPDRGVMHFAYDDASNLIATRDAKNQRVTYTYDGANRIRTENYHDGRAPPPWRSSDDGRAHSVVYHYDTPFPDLLQGDNTASTGRNVKGALAWVEDLSGEEHTSYDSRGRVEWVVKRIPDPQFLSYHGSSPLVSYRTAFSYDSLDRNIRLVYPDNDEVSYAYDDRNLLQSIIGGVNGLTRDGYVVPAIRYAPSGQMERTDYGNGVRTTHTYDSRLRLKQILTVSQRVAPAQELIHFAYDFDGVSNIKSITDQRPGMAVPEGDSRRNTQLFQYDDLYRLTRAQYSFALPGANPRNDGEINYRYDRIGNMLAQTSTFTNHLEKGLPVADLGEMDSGGIAGRWGRKGRGPNEDPGPHALTHIRNQKSEIRNREYPYDANGNMTNIDGFICTWDFKNRLIAVEHSEMRAAYTYDYTDRRIAKDVSYKPGSTHFTNHEPRITTLYVNRYFEVREHDAPIKYVWNGNTRIARVTGSLNTNMRVQRLRVTPGWNLCSMAVSCPSPFWGEGRGEVLSAAFRWNPLTLGWDEVLPNDILAGGAVLWLKASTNAILSFTGVYSDPTNRIVVAGGNFLPSAGLEDWDFIAAISSLPAASAWTYDAFSSRWVSQTPPPLEHRSDLPRFLAPGEAGFVQVDDDAPLRKLEMTMGILYYLQDHLCSSTVVADSVGRPVHATAYYPYGEPRQEIPHHSRQDTYTFAQQETDAETRLQYYGARYCAGVLARFLSVDPPACNPPTPAASLRLAYTLRVGLPQTLNVYACALGNPLRYVDPSGQQVELVEEHEADRKLREYQNRVSGGQEYPASKLTAEDRALFQSAMQVLRTTEEGKSILGELEEAGVSVSIAKENGEFFGERQSTKADIGCWFGGWSADVAINFEQFVRRAKESGLNEGQLTKSVAATIGHELQHVLNSTRRQCGDGSEVDQATAADRALDTGAYPSLNPRQAKLEKELCVPFSANSQGKKMMDARVCK